MRAATLLSAMTANLKAETERLGHDIEDLSRPAHRSPRSAKASRGRRLPDGREGAPLGARRGAQTSLSGGRVGAGLAAEAGRRSRQPGRDAQGPDRSDRPGGGAAQGAGAGRAAADEHAARDIEARAEKAQDIQPVQTAPGISLLRREGTPAPPVAGTILKAFGSSDGLGGTEHGILVATLAGAVVSAPADGSVLYSGPIELWTTLDHRRRRRILCAIGRHGAHLRLASAKFVLAGEPVGVGRRVVEDGGRRR